MGRIGIRTQRQGRLRARGRRRRQELWASLPHNPKKTFIVTLESYYGEPTKTKIDEIEIVSTTPKQVKARLWNCGSKILNIREKEV